MSFTIGIVLALLTAVITRLAGFDRDRALYPTLLIVIASYYVLFAVLGGSMHALVIEVVAMSLFSTVAIVGFKSNLWLVAVALAGHGAFDLVHDRLVSNPGVPTWWPTFCLAFDVFLAGIFAWLLRSGALKTRAELPG